MTTNPTNYEFELEAVLNSETRGDTSTDSVRVLYLDDEPGYAGTAAEFLELEAGIDTVVTETDPQAALERIDEEPIDCVVSDYDMPKLTGLDVLNSVRETRPNLPVLLVTGQGNEEIASKAISAGATDYVQKRRGTDQYALLAHRVSKAVEQYRTDTLLQAPTLVGRFS